MSVQSQVRGLSHNCYIVKSRLEYLVDYPGNTFNLFSFDNIKSYFNTDVKCTNLKYFNNSPPNNTCMVIKKKRKKEGNSY